MSRWGAGPTLATFNVPPLFLHGHRNRRVGRHRCYNDGDYIGRRCGWYPRRTGCGGIVVAATCRKRKRSYHAKKAQSSAS